MSRAGHKTGGGTAAVARVRRLARRAAADPSLTAGMLLFAAAALASALWFSSSEDEHGKTARLEADASYYHAYLPSLLFDRDLDFTAQYRVTGNWYRFADTPVGRPGNVFGIGPALFSMPLFGAGHALARATGAEADGFSRPEVVATLSGSVLFSLGALFFCARLIRRRLGGGLLAVGAPLLLACAGPVVYYAIRQPGYAHPFAVFFAAWLSDAFDRSFGDGGARDPGPRSLRVWVTLGVLLGLAALARPQLATWGVLLVIAAADDVRRVLRAANERARRARAALAEALRVAGPRWLAGAAAALVVFSPQLLAWKAIYGSALAVPQGPGFMRWDAPAWSEVLFSSRNGLFPWAPLYALAAVGLVAALRRHPRLAGALLLGVALQTIANGAVWDWWGGGSFGGRRFDSCFAPFAFGLAYLVVRPARPAGPAGWRRQLRRAGVAALLALALALAVANLRYAAEQSSRTARMRGGEPAAKILREKVEGRSMRVAARASELANLPARALFALRHRVSLSDYDVVVGPHVLGELYPGLNSFRGKTHEAVSIDPERSGVVGLVRAGGEVRLAEGRARVLIGLNRRGPVTFAVRAAAPQGARELARLELWLDGVPVAAGVLGEEPVAIAGEAETVRRGVNVLEIRAPAGTGLLELTVSAPRNPSGI